MLKIVLCLLGVLALLLLDEFLAGKKILKAEHRRKFVHITVGVFVASWPWLMSWRALQIVGLLMLAIVAFNNYRPIINFNKDVDRKSYGDYTFAIAIVVCALLTQVKVLFALAMITMAVADGLAAVIGKQYGMGWKYRVLNQPKTLLGSAVFWVTSLCILGVGILFAHSLISFNHYAVLILLLPPILTLLENVSLWGLDNLVVPVVIVLALRLAQ